MICHEFKGGTGTSSRVVVENGERIRSARSCRRIMARAICCGSMACLSVGRSGPMSCRRIARAGRRAQEKTEGSIIVVLATDAPLIPLQCQRLARRATTGLAWVGGIGANGSGDIFIAFSTGNHFGQNDRISNVRMLAPTR